MTRPHSSLREQPPELADALASIRSAHARTPTSRATLVAVSGIDAGGKGVVAAELRASLRGHGLNVALINVDGWLAPPAERADPRQPALHFYERGIRFGALFAELVLPLRRTRSVRLRAQLANPSRDGRLLEHVYEFRDIDVVIVEGVFLLRRSLRSLYDLAIWVACTRETALTRAIARNQEGLAPAELERDYRTIYFPAQDLHAMRDHPRATADVVVVNDSRLAVCAGRVPAALVCDR